MIAELIRQYDTLKRCNIPIPDPYFDEMEVWIEVILKLDGSFRVEWMGKKNTNTANDKKSAKEEPCKDKDCPVTEKSACRSSGNDSPHGLVDNGMWIFGEFATEKQLQKKEKLQQAEQKNKKKAKKKTMPSDEARRTAYLNQLKAFSDFNPEALKAVRAVYDCLNNDDKRKKIWDTVENLLKEKICKNVKGKEVKLFEEDQAKWKNIASKLNIRWVIEQTGESGKPLNSLDAVKTGWKSFQEIKNEWHIKSLVDGQQKPARILHPRIKGASLVSFNNVATYCGHLSPEYRSKPEKGKEATGDGSALPAQIGFEEAEKYSKALGWLIDKSSVRFGDSVNCIWIDQGQSEDQVLDQGAYELVKPQGEKSVFKRGKAKKDKGQVVADSSDLIKSLEKIRNGQKAHYRENRFYMLSLLLRRKGRHAILGGYVGNMGHLDDNAQSFVNRTKILIPPKYLHKKDEEREFCPSLMDILSAAGIKSEKKQRLVWDREVVEVIVAGRPLPADLCRLVIQKTIKDKHLERSEDKCSEYLALLAIAAGCARHYLTANQGKEDYGMGLNENITDSGYLAGRIFALCENIQKRGRSWGATLSDKLFSAAIHRPKQTLAELYKNCLCYDIYKADSDWFQEIFAKVKLSNADSGQGEAFPENGVDQFAFMLGYWHQRCELKKETGKGANNSDNVESPTAK